MLRSCVPADLNTQRVLRVSGRFPKFGKQGRISGVHSRFGQESDRCFIDNIYGSPVNNLGGVARFVVIDPDGRLGTEWITQQQR